MNWFSWKLSCVSAISGLAVTGGLIVVYKGSVSLFRLDWVGEVPASSIDQNLSRLGCSLVAVVIVVTCSCGVGKDMGPDRRNPSLDC